MNIKTEKFVHKARAIHGNAYDYTKTVYTKGNENIIITCPKHGDFQTTPYKHLNKTFPKRCPTCGKAASSGKKTLDQVIDDFKEAHGDKYGYSKVVYEHSDIPVEIWCNVHEEFFWQKPRVHKLGYGCVKCGRENSANLRRKR